MGNGRHAQVHQDGGDNLTLHTGEPKPFWFKHGSSAAPTLVLPAAPAIMQSIPSLSGLPSSLSWEEGRWAGEAYRKKFSKCLDTAATAFQKLSLVVPEHIYKTNSVHCLYQHLRSSVLEAAEISPDDEQFIQFEEDHAKYSLMDADNTFYGFDLSYIDTSNLSSKGKAAYYGIASLLVNVNNIVHVSDYTEPYVEMIMDEYAEDEENDTVYLHEGSHQMGVDAFLTDVAEMKAFNQKFSFVNDINTDSVEQLIEDSDLDLGLQSNMQEFAKVSREIGSLFNYYISEDDLGDNFFAGYMFYITGRNDNSVTEMYLSSVWEDCMNHSASKFETKINYDYFNIQNAKQISNNMHRFRDLFETIIVSIPHIVTT